MLIFVKFLHKIDIVYRLQGFGFEWDKNKAQSNFEKHGVTFEEVAEVFCDPFYPTGDTSGDDDKQRELMAYKARPATHTARKLYEQA